MKPPGHRMWHACLLLLAMQAITPLAGAAEIIVSPDVPVQSLSRSEARALFSMRKTRWPNGRPTRVFVLAEDSPAHQSLCKEALDLYPYQLREAVMRGVYTGVTQAPTHVESEEEMKWLVARTPGAIGYVTVMSKNDHVRTLSIR